MKAYIEAGGSMSGHDFGDQYEVHAANLVNSGKMPMATLDRCAHLCPFDSVSCPHLRSGVRGRDRRPLNCKPLALDLLPTLCFAPHPPTPCRAAGAILKVKARLGLIPGAFAAEAKTPISALSRVP